ncbi:MAG TPA: hypothetical protein VKR52_11035 [Terracidiphilus sp.]|nr:hypothetical protein [Terracidiphilus sp.]
MQKLVPGFMSLFVLGAGVLLCGALVAGNDQQASLRSQSAIDTPRQAEADRNEEFEAASVRIMEDREKLPSAQQMFSMSPPGAGEFTLRNATLDLLIGWAFQVAYG